MTDHALIRASSPVFVVDGETRGELARDILRLDVAECTAGLKGLELHLVGHGPDPRTGASGRLYQDGSVLDLGKPLVVSIGFGPEARRVFDGTISAIEVQHQEGSDPRVVVFAEDRLMDLRMTRRFRTYNDVTDADVVREIASDHGLSAEVDADGPSYDVLQQWNMSDLAFLRERARLLQAEIWLRDDKLFFKTRDKREGTELTLVQGNHLIQVCCRADLAHQRTHVHLGGYDAGSRAPVDEEADDSAIRAETSGGRTGPEILDRAFGERHSHRVREAPLADAEARAWARAEMLRRARGFVQVEAVARGIPDMVVGSRLRLERLGPSFDGGGYYATRVRHAYDLERGHRTHFEAERATLGGA